MSFCVYFILNCIILIKYVICYKKFNYMYRIEFLKIVIFFDYRNDMNEMCNKINVWFFFYVYV